MDDQTDPAGQPPDSLEPEGSDSNADDSSDDSDGSEESDGPSAGRLPDVFEMDAEINMSEYSEYSHVFNPWNRSHQHCDIAINDLGADDIDLLRLFSLQINDPSVTDKLLKQIAQLSRYEFESLYLMKKRLEELSELMAESYDCCVKSCVAFTGPYAGLKECPRCRKPRYRRNGKPVKTYRYIPLIPQLVAYFLNRELNKRMRYRSDGHPNTEANKEGRMTDIFDGSHYRELLEKEVTINGHGVGHTYFSDDRDIALGLASDGISPWWHRKATFWPILLYNFNLPPDER